MNYSLIYLNVRKKNKFTFSSETNKLYITILNEMEWFPKKLVIKIEYKMIYNRDRFDFSRKHFFFMKDNENLGS